MEMHVDWVSIETLPYFGLDEIALKKGHKDFVVIVSTRVEDKVKILAILSDRKKETVTTVCSDMYDGYINAAKEVFGNKIKVVIDRFHIAKNYRSCVDTLRKQELKRLKKELNETDYAKLKGAMWALRKNKEAYDFRNSLTDIFNQNLNKGEAAILIKEWMNNVKASQLSCFDKFIDTLSKNWHEILNYFYHRQRKNSGFIEGLNNKIKVIKRRCYGIFDLTRLFQRITLDLTGYERFA